MSGLYRDEGVVLRAIKLGEADRIVTIFTQGHGKVRAVAKGIRKTTSKFGARLEPTSRVALQCYKGRELDIVTRRDRFIGRSARSTPSSRSIPMLRRSTRSRRAGPTGPLPDAHHARTRRSDAQPARHDGSSGAARSKASIRYSAAARCGEETPPTSTSSSRSTSRRAAPCRAAGWGRPVTRRTRAAAASRRRSQRRARGDARACRARDRAPRRPRARASRRASDALRRPALTSSFRPSSARGGQ